MNINDLLNTAFIDENGSVKKLSKKYDVDVCVIGCQYVKILFALESLEKGKDYDYYKEISERRLENWIRANYK